MPAELVFDQGFGDLFVIRVAGNIVAPSQVGSVEFAASRFGTRLVVVMGHTQCGAITATLEELYGQSTSQSANLRAIVNRVSPSVVTLYCPAGPTKIPTCWCAKPFAPTCVRRWATCAMAPSCWRRLIAETGLLVVGAEVLAGNGSGRLFRKRSGRRLTHA